jgi:hypothetical protein
VRRSTGLRQRMRRSRVLGWDRNPVRRRIDRVEAVLLAGLIALLLLGGPALAGVAGRGIRAGGQRQQHAEATWRPEWAVIGGRAAYPALPWASVPAGRVARWTAPDGQLRTGRILVEPEVAAGSRTRVWVNRQGALTGPPLRAAQLRDRVLTARLLTYAGLGVLLGFAAGAGRYLLRRHRLAGWEREWQVLEPWWTKSRYRR